MLGAYGWCTVPQRPRCMDFAADGQGGDRPPRGVPMSLHELAFAYTITGTHPGPLMGQPATGK